MLSGLPAIARNLRALPCLARRADAAIIEMGAMVHDECVASTRMILDAFGATTPAASTDGTAAWIDAMACGWPLAGKRSAGATRTPRAH